MQRTFMPLIRSHLHNVSCFSYFLIGFLPVFYLVFVVSFRLRCVLLPIPLCIRVFERTFFLSEFMRNLILFTYLACRGILRLAPQRNQVPHYSLPDAYGSGLSCAPP
ncbi:hypothetical protein BDZ94DRAFT_92760 [Collybia nuda]|uniref:Uncharacterized protein n=1 Tax=Collybia nuda TaxID=64659 RepID=A0A9P5YE27_9AGAR|nr:hypothetical protein BDZ94DRAFT_92760 [Collybia nuda]